VPEIDEDVALALRLGGRGTPTVILQGQILASSPDSASLSRMVRDLIDHG
jgi:protein-disulfide isomerase